MLSDCESFNGSTLTLVVKTRHHNGTTITTPMYSDNVSMFVVDHLELNSFYSFSIRSRNAIGERLTGAVNFSKSSCFLITYYYTIFLLDDRQSIMSSTV